MSKTEDLILRVQALVADVDKTHRYSMSRIYGLYNEVYDTSEIPQSCASCLIRKVKQLKEWLNIRQELKDKNLTTRPATKKRASKKSK